MKTLAAFPGFIPYLLIVFLNAFVDLGHKIVIQNTIFKIWDGETQVILTAIINAMILLPFILLFSPSGFLSDRFPKDTIIRYGALAAVVITLMITAAYALGWFWPAFALTLLLAIQSAIYSPAKYGYLRELMTSKTLVRGNAVVQSVTIIAILAGTFVFSALFEWLIPARFSSPSDILTELVPLGWLLVALCLIEWAASKKLERKYAGDHSRVFALKAMVSGQYLNKNLTAIKQHPTIFGSILGLSLFWAISQVVLAAFPAYAEDHLNMGNTLIIQGLLACTGIGIMLGSLMAGRLSQTHIESGLIPVGATGIALMLLIFPAMIHPVMLGSLFIALGFFGGLFIVPLNSLIQHHAKEEEIGTVLAGNNWIQNIGMLSFLGMTVAFSMAGVSSITLLHLLSVAAIAGALFSFRKLTHEAVRLTVGRLMQLKYPLTIKGLDHLPKDKGVLLLGNHISWIDWAFVQIASRRPIRFVMIRDIYNLWYLKPFLKFFGAIPVSPGNSSAALRLVNECLKKGEVVCIFPEGAITRTGHLGEFRTGFERTVNDVDGVIVPFYLHGLWGSKLSRSGSRKLRKNTAGGFRRKVIIAFGEARPLTTKAPGIKQQVLKLSVAAREEEAAKLNPLPLAFLKSAKKHWRKAGLIDATGVEISNGKTIAATLGFAKKMRQISSDQTVGLLLPTSPAGAVANLAVMLNGQTAVNLNFTASKSAIKSAMDTANIKTIYTSSEFLERLTEKSIDTESLCAGKQIIFLEDIKQSLSKPLLASYLIMAHLLPAHAIYRFFGKPVTNDHTAQILFSSGSEGKPKGILLSHKNILGNIRQTRDMMNTSEHDKVMASLPLFHSFGLTVTCLLPLMEGIPAICHPDPTDATGVAKAIAKNKATILFGTATFLRLYTRNRKITRNHFDSLRLVVSGAEKLPEAIRNDFEEKFGKTVYEGYGATETAPVAAVNLPDQPAGNGEKPQIGHKPGSVGLPLPGSCIRIVDPTSHQTLPAGNAGLVLIAGIQVMKGYLNDPKRTDEAIFHHHGNRWYKTGDQGVLDHDGFLTIVDRYSRFAKIGGEMISLGEVEQAIREILGHDTPIAATSMKDEKKGEKIVLLIEGTADSGDLAKKLLEAGIPPIMTPSTILPVPKIPMLSTGKTDFSALKKLAESFPNTP